MKFLISALLTSILGASSIAHATVIDPKKAHNVMRSLSDWVLSIEGASGVGLAFCNAVTGERAIKGSGIYCLSIKTATADGYSKLLELFPLGTQKNRLFIVIDPPTGTDCPRMSAGS